MKTDITRRRALAVTGATTVTAAAPLAAQAAPIDPVPALYEAWRKAAAKTNECFDRVGDAEEILLCRYGSLYPRVQVGGRWFYCEEDIKEAYGPAVLLGGRKGVKRLEERLAEYRQQYAKWEAVRKELGLPDLDGAAQRASKAETAICRKALATPATTPEGAAMKLRITLYYALPDLREDIEEGDSFAGQSIAAALRDLHNMSANQ